MVTDVVAEEPVALVVPLVGVAEDKEPAVDVDAVVEATSVEAAGGVARVVTDIVA